MEKIKITEEQEEAYKILLKNSNYDAYRVLKDFSTIGDKQRVYNQYKPLLSLTIEELSLILNRWYEVEQPFKVGDWVINENGSGDYYKISEEFISSMKFLTIDTVLCEPENFKKVEEPWKIMLLELGRDKPEFKVGDIVERIGGAFTRYYSGGDLVLVWAKANEIEYIHPVESRIEVKQ